MKKLIIGLCFILMGCSNNVESIDNIDVSLPTEEVVSIRLPVEESEPVVEDKSDQVEEDDIVTTAPVKEEMTKEDIMWLQESLKISGFYTARDGDLGPATEKTLLDFQKSYGIDSGEYDQVTFEIFNTLRQERLALNYKTDLVLLNKKYFLPSEFVPEALREVNVDKNKYMELPEHVASAVEQMFTDAKEDGITIVLASAYRSYDYQEGIFSRQVAKNGFAEAETVVAIPGQSEHQTGLAIDITTSKMDFDLEQTFENDPAFAWMMENCHKYGFILRYLKGREDETGYIYEPWHYRYVGDIKIAKSIMDQGLILEEYFE